MVLTRNRDCERRLALLEMLRNRYDHPDAQECYRSMRRLIPNIGRSTVYRHLAKLVAVDLILEMHPVSGPARYDAKMDQHAHFLCNNCQILYDTPEIVLKGSWPGTAETVEIVAKGLCKKCTKQ